MFGKEKQMKQEEKREIKEGTLICNFEQDDEKVRTIITVNANNKMMIALIKSLLDVIAEKRGTDRLEVLSDITADVLLDL